MGDPAVSRRRIWPMHSVFYAPSSGQVHDKLASVIVEYTGIPHIHGDSVGDWKYCLSYHMCHLEFFAGNRSSNYIIHYIV